MLLSYLCYFSCPSLLIVVVDRWVDFVGCLRLLGLFLIKGYDGLLVDGGESRVIRNIHLFLKDVQLMSQPLRLLNYFIDIEIIFLLFCSFVHHVEELLVVVLKAAFEKETAHRGVQPQENTGAQWKLDLVQVRGAWIILLTLGIDVSFWQLNSVESRNG